MDEEDDMAPTTSDDGLDLASAEQSSSLSLSQNSPSIPAEGDWLEAEDLDRDRWVKPEDIDSMWGDAALPALSNRVNNLDSAQNNTILNAYAPNTTTATHPPAFDFSLQSRPDSAAWPDGDQPKALEPSPKRARLSSSPSPFKSPARTHHTVIPVKPPPDLAEVAVSSPHPSKEETLFTDTAQGSPVDSQDDTGSSGDVSASLRQLHAASTADASSPHSEGVTGSASVDDMLGSQEDQASSHDYETDDGSESSDGFEGVAMRFCVNCTSRMHAEDVICLVGCQLPHTSPALSPHLACKASVTALYVHFCRYRHPCQSCTHAVSIKQF